MKFENSRTGQSNPMVVIGIGVKGKIIPEFLEEIEVASSDPQLILYLAIVFNRIDIVRYFTHNIYEELDFAEEKEYVQIIAAKYGYDKIVELCEIF